MSAIHTSTIVTPFAQLGQLRRGSKRVDAQAVADVAEANTMVETELKPRPANVGWHNPDWWQDRHYERR